MSWQDILKNTDRERWKDEHRLGLEIELEQLLHSYGDDKDIFDWDSYADRNGPNVQGLEIDVTFDDAYEGEEDLTNQEKYEQEAGHYRIDFSSEGYEEFAMGDYTYNDGFNIHEYNPEKLDINTLKEIISGLK